MNPSQNSTRRAFIQSTSAIAAALYVSGLPAAPSAPPGSALARSPTRKARHLRERQRQVTVTAAGVEALNRALQAYERLLDGLNLVRGAHA